MFIYQKISDRIQLCLDGGQCVVVVVGGGGHRGLEEVGGLRLVRQRHLELRVAQAFVLAPARNVEINNVLNVNTV